MVVFVDGVPDKRVLSQVQDPTVTNDDFAAMYEVLTRRFKRAAAAGPDDDPAWARPDLLVIDGGKGQLGMAVTALTDLGVAIGGDNGLEVIGLAKERDLAAGDAPDRVYLRNVKDAVQLRPNSAELFVLARIRDEAHRFANTFHRERRRSKTALRTELDEIPGVGALNPPHAALRHFGSVKGVKAASLDELAAATGMNRAAAAVHDFFAEQPAAPEASGEHRGVATDDDAPR